MIRPLRLLVLVAVTALVSAACSDGGGLKRDETGTIVEPGDESVFEIRVGDCLSPSLDLGEAIEDILAVPCDEPHTHEVYAEITYDENDVYPGAAELERFSDVACLREFPDYVGLDYFDSGLFFTYLYPTLDGWNDKNDREVVCLVGLPGEQLAESVRGSGGDFEIFIPPPVEGSGDEPGEGSSTS